MNLSTYYAVSVSGRNRLYGVVRLADENKDKVPYNLRGSCGSASNK